MELKDFIALPALIMFAAGVLLAGIVQALIAQLRSKVAG
jgi:hypothetical protein